MKKYVAVIPARAGSKGIPKKNIKLLAGKPLIQWTVEAALNSKYISEAIVSTDSLEIANISKNLGAVVPFLRPAKLSTDSAATIDVVLHALERYRKFDYIVLLQPTSPLRTATDIDNAIELMVARSSESCVSICPPSNHPYLMYSVDSTGRLTKLIASERSDRRQNLPSIYAVNGAIYVSNINQLYSSRSFILADTVGFEMPVDRSVDIDNNFDFMVAEYLLSTQTKSIT